MFCLKKVFLRSLALISTGQRDAFGPLVMAPGEHKIRQVPDFSSKSSQSDHIFGAISRQQHQLSLSNFQIRSASVHTVRCKNFTCFEELFIFTKFGTRNESWFKKAITERENTFQNEWPHLGPFRANYENTSKKAKRERVHRIFTGVRGVFTGVRGVLMISTNIVCHFPTVVMVSFLCTSRQDIITIYRCKASIVHQKISTQPLRRLLLKEQRPQKYSYGTARRTTPIPSFRQIDMTTRESR